MLAAIWQGPVVRLIPVGMLLLALQRSLFVEITIAGVTIQVVLALAAATSDGLLDHCELWVRNEAGDH